jgi:hypothetical protein
MKPATDSKLMVLDQTTTLLAPAQARLTVRLWRALIRRLPSPIGAMNLMRIDSRGGDRGESLRHNSRGLGSSCRSPAGSRLRRRSSNASPRGVSARRPHTRGTRSSPTSRPPPGKQNASAQDRS